jgi:serine/threonine-protein kinase
MALPGGTRLGPYEILTALGAGGMGEVYRARDTRLGRHVAIKVLPPDAADTMSRERFEREARTVSGLSHPNICPLFDVGEQDGLSYLVMECLEGESLATLLGREALSVERVLFIASQIADGLAHAHAAGVIHRDLKPGNVMVLPGGTIKILDFGLARKLAGTADATIANLSAPGIVSGTLAYMSPEQTLGGHVDHRSDIFSLGVVVYEMLSGRRPFEAPSAFALMHKVVNEHVAPIDAVRAGVPPAVARFLERMMAKSPDARPASAAEVRSVFSHQFAAPPAGTPVSGPSSSASAMRTMPPPLATTSARRWGAVGLGVAVLAIGVLAVAPGCRTFIINQGRSLFGPSENQASATVALPQNATDWARRGRAYLGRYDQKGNVDLAIEAFVKAIELNPKAAAAHAGLSESYLQKDSLTPDAQLVRQSVEAGQQAVTLNPDLAASHAALGLALLRAKQPEDGHREILKAQDLEPTNLSALRGLGEYQMSKGETAQAEATYRRAVQAAPSEWMPAQLLGRSLFAQSKYLEAAAVWEEADRKTPDNIQILRNLGAVYQMLERNDDAAAALQRALAIEPSATVYTNLGTLRYFQGRYSDAATAFEKAVALNATYFLYWANLGDAYRWIPGSGDKARQAFGRAIALVDERLRGAPDDPDLRTRLAMYLAKQGDVTRAADELQRWRASKKATPSSHFRALIVHELAGDRDQALRHLDAALRAGYAIRDIQNEPELTRLRSDPRYHRVLATFETTRPR